MTSKPWVLLPLLLLGAGGCEDSESERCVSLYKSAQVAVRDAHSGSEASVSQGREAVLSAMAACRSAGKTNELNQLVPALARLDAQLVYLRARPSSAPKKELSPLERAELLRSGDPKCPKGQGYKDKATGKEVRCRGPQLVYLSWAKAKEYFAKSMELNPRYVPGLVHLAEAIMSAENYDSAEKVLAEVEKVNPKLPRLWALRAAIAHLQGRYESEGESRRLALVPWNLNPEVDYTIGKQLSMHYRFTESTDYQRRALKMDAEYTPAKTQLAQDLLRLGQTDQGWEIVDNVRCLLYTSPSPRD